MTIRSETRSAEITHPWWCQSGRVDYDERIAAALERRDPRGPQEEDSLHSGRDYQVEAHDQSVNVRAGWLYEVDEGVAVMLVQGPHIELRTTHHASVDCDSSAWLDLPAARQLVEMLGRAISDAERCLAWS